MSVDERAEALFKQGYNCAQSVLAAHSEALGLSEDAALKMAAPLGGGIARMAETCGAVTGAMMVLGLRHCTTEAGDEAKARAYSLGRQFLERFNAIHGTMCCKDLVGYDISTAEGMQAAKDSGAIKAKCPGFVRDAARIVAEML